MFGIRTLARHAALVNEMADTVGADLPLAIAEGRISGEAMRGAVVRCTTCERVGACERWLATHEAGTVEPPGYCLNAALFSTLTTDPRP